ncbi:hypothetical protein SAY86_013576 [Trapa natans]|uniref:K Homology domain-containing protein n=1 Tax=Trapa natans TaxID=22666 RepID=A0AAN7KYW1_TRANT|nr:hypothetical protein SAY86_013576 [Trapa natans]
MEHMMRRKKVNLVWRSVSAQASTHEEVEIKDVRIESEEGIQAQEIEVVSGVEISNDAHTGNSGVSLSERHSISFEVGSSLMRFIKGKGGSTQKKIEEDMGVKIVFPTSREEESIVIEGSSADSVARASNKIQTAINEAVESRSLDYSHFVSLPLAIHPELVDKLFFFQKSILGNDVCPEDINIDTEYSESGSEYSEGRSQQVTNVAVKFSAEDGNEQVKVDISSIKCVSYAPKEKPRESETSSLSELGIDKSIFIKPKTFHLTVLMLKLWNKKRVDLAAEVLQKIFPKVMDALDNRPIFIRLKGLDCMRGSLAKASVLYVPVEEIGNEDRLLRACRVIIDAYMEAGLVLEKDAKQTLKLHATVMNARHRKRNMRTKRFDSFDARGIFRQYGDEEWGDYMIREAHLSQRFMFGDSGYYHCCASIPFPQSMQQSEDQLV